jgi:hypothetical protein
MAYFPSLEDIPDEQNIPQNVSRRTSYVPTMEDINEIESKGKLLGNLPSSQYSLGQLMPEYKDPEQMKRAIMGAGGAALMFAQPELIPLRGAIPYAINALGRIGIGTAGSTAFETARPEEKRNALDIAKQNLKLNALLESVPIALKGGTKAIQSITAPFRPEAHLQSILDKLGFGSKTLSQNAQSLSSDIKNAHDIKLEESLSKLNPILEKHGAQDIYPMINPTGYHAYRDMPEFELKTTDKKLGRVYDEFKKRPTFQNSQDFQSELGKRIGYISNQKIKPQEMLDELSSLKETRDEVKSGMLDYLRKNDPTMVKQYKDFSNTYRDKVVPYYSDKTLRSIVEGKETNPKNVHNIFEYPTSVKGKKGPIQTITEHLPEESKHKILYSKIGGHNKNENPEKFIKNIEKAKSEGFEDYITEELKGHEKSLKSKLEKQKKLKEAKEGLTKSAYTLGSAGLGAYLGGPYGAAGGALAGMTAVPPMMKGLGSAISAVSPPVNKLLEPLSNAYRPAGRFLMTQNFGENE